MQQPIPTKVNEDTEEMKVEIQNVAPIVEVIVPNVPRNAYKGGRRDFRKQLYYALYINGKQIRVEDVRNGKKWPPREKQVGLCIAWVEENVAKNRNHFFRITLRM